MARRAAAAKKKEKKPRVEWERLELIEKDANKIKDREHTHLERAHLVVIGKPGRVGSSLCHGIVKLRVPTNPERAMAKHEGFAVDYVIEVKREPYDKLTADQKQRRLDHALCHALGKDERDRWITDKKHDVEEFEAILKRHGAPDDNPAFGPMAKQMSLFAKGGK
jgi:hypothetical protein